MRAPKTSNAKIITSVFLDPNILTLLLTGVLGILFYVKSASASGKVRRVFLDEHKIERVQVHPGRSTVLHFPVKPENSALGMKGIFGLHYIESDIVVDALRPQGATNLFVYLLGRRFAFELVTSGSAFDEIVDVLDTSEREQSEAATSELDKLKKIRKKLARPSDGGSHE